VARAGVYPKSIASAVSAERLQRFFIEEKNGYKVKKEIREMVVFGVHNLIKDTSFTKMDLISCRNLLIYFNAELQKRLFPIFHFSLKAKGILFLGGSEAISGYSELFQPATKKWKIFERKDSDAVQPGLINMLQTNLILPPIMQVAASPSDVMLTKFNFNQLQAIKQYLLENYLAHCVVINKQGDVLYTHGDIKKYLRATPRRIEYNIFQAISPKLSSPLVEALRKVSKQKKPVTLSNLQIKSKESTLKINLQIIPLVDVDYLQDFFCIVFEKYVRKSLVKAESFKNKTASQLENMNYELQNKLQQAKESLQCTIEELQSSNEELQSTNEELQSSNEELETSKEEMESLNEELVIVNTELQYRIDQFVVINDDMVNLFNSTGIMALFLDVNFRVKRFTPEVRDLVSLIQADVGRSINDFSIAIDYKDLMKDARDVLNKLNQKKFDVLGKNGRCYEVHMMPYKTMTHVIDGVIIVFTDITAHKESQDKLKKLNSDLKHANHYIRSIFDTVQECLLVLSADLKITSANKSFYRQFKYRERDVIGKLIYDLDDGQLSQPNFIDKLNLLIEKDRSFDGYDIVYNFAPGDTKKITINARKILKIDTDTDTVGQILLTICPHLT
jgi:two-component system CheB/CheR fusion protein